MSPGQQPLTHSHVSRPDPTSTQELITTSFAAQEGPHHPKRGGATFPWALLGNTVGLQILCMGQTALRGPWVSSNHSLQPGELGLSGQGQRCAGPACEVPHNCPLEKPTPAATGHTRARLGQDLGRTPFHPALPQDNKWPVGLETVPSHRARRRGQHLVPIHRTRCRR